MDWESLLDSVETESDWPKEAVAFQSIEKSLKCAICHGTMRTAVMLTKCGHSFCSYCIRQSLYKEQICPLCRKPATESDIVRNVSVNDIADAFREHRAELLSFCNQMYFPIQANRTSDDHEVDKPKTEEKVSSKESTPVKEAHGLDTTNSVLSDTTDSSYEFEESCHPFRFTRSDPPQKRFKKTVKTCAYHCTVSRLVMVECPICHDFFDQNIIEVILSARIHSRYTQAHATEQSKRNPPSHSRGLLLMRFRYCPCLSFILVQGASPQPVLPSHENERNKETTPEVQFAHEWLSRRIDRKTPPVHTPSCF